jgi:hypothetical protein
MSNITTVYNAIQTTIAALFPSKYELSDPSVIDNNDTASLANGYGIDFGSALNSNRVIGCVYSIQRTINITVTRQFLGGHKSNTLLDDANKLLLEDLHLLIKEFEKNNVIGGAVANRKFISDGGIERVFGENKTFIMIRAQFQIEYSEDLN